MAETANIAEVASVLSSEIFKYFHWHTHPKKDDNFDCLDEKHVSDKGKVKKTHPTDVVFSYDDPYSPRRINLLTDLKSYAGKSITHNKIRQALKSLAMSVECAAQSSQWREKFGVTESEPNEVRGLLFVHNHDFKFQKSFYEELKKVHSDTLPIAPSSILHYLGPDDIQRLFSTANDIARLQHAEQLPKDYSFYYPDLVLRRRNREVSGQPATFESLAGPFLIIRHRAEAEHQQGYLIYYNRPCQTVEEFEYLLDCFSRFQLEPASEEGLKRNVITLQGVTDPKLRSQFFFDLIHGLPGYILKDVTDVFVYKAGDEEIGADGDPHIERVGLRGTGVTQTEYLARLAKDDYYIVKVGWRFAEQLGKGTQYAAEALFTNPAECTGFSYILLGVHDSEAGVVSEHRRTPNKVEITLISRAIEARARKLLSDISSKVNDESED